MPVTMIPVEGSKAIREIGHDPATNELHVHFTNGGYVYDNVSPEKFSALLAAESKGTHLHREIKPLHTHRKKDADGTR